MTIALTIFYIFWLCTVLAFLLLIWRDTSRYIHKMEEVMLQSRAVSAEAALKAAEAAQTLAELLKEERHAH